MPFYCEMKWLLITEFFVTLPNMKILFIPNWRVNRLSTDVPTIQAPDKQVQGEPYWFFKYFPEGTQVDIIDIGEENQFRKIEHKIPIKDRDRIAISIQPSGLYFNGKLSGQESFVKPLNTHQMKGKIHSV